MVLGMKVDFYEKEVRISQKKYIDYLLEKFGMTDCRAVDTPLSEQ